MFLSRAFVVIITIPYFLFTLLRRLITLIRYLSDIFVVLYLTDASKYMSIGPSFQLRGRTYRENAGFILTDSLVCELMRRIQTHGDV